MATDGLPALRGDAPSSSFQAMAAVAATLVFLSLALLAVKLSYRARYRAGAEGGAEAD